MRFEEQKKIAIEIAEKIKNLNSNGYLDIQFDNDGGYIEVDGVEFYFDENLNYQSADISL